MNRKSARLTLSLRFLFAALLLAALGWSVAGQWFNAKSRAMAHLRLNKAEIQEHDGAPFRVTFGVDTSAQVVTSLSVFRETILFVSFRDVKISAAHLAELSTCTKILGIDLTRSDCTDDVCQELKHFKRLDSLRLRSNPVGDGIGETIVQLTDLTEIDLNATDVTDRIIHSLVKLPHLETVHLESTKVSGAGLSHLLSNSPNLLAVYLSSSQIEEFGTEDERVRLEIE